MKILKILQILLTTSIVLSMGSCSTFIAPKFSSKPMAIAERDSVKSDMVMVVTPTTEPKPAVVKIEKKSSEGAQEVIEMANNVEPIEIPPFTSEQSAHVVISEFSNHALFEDITLQREELSGVLHYPANGYITSNYGWRGQRMHSGIDIKAYLRDNIYAALDGVVRVAMYNGAYGNCVVIRHYNGLETLYAHATKMLVKVNDKVKAGDVIALAGRTGRATGVHLHFEVRAAGQCIDPNLIFDTTERKFNEKNLYLTMRSGRIFASNNDDITQREEEIKMLLAVKYHVVKSGDTLSRIAINNKTTVSAICKLNNISSRSIIKIGQRLRVR